MQYTIAGFYENYKEKVNFVAGRGGMTRRIGSAGILDYEFLPKLRGKYRHSNFQEDQLIITTFLYAKENEYLISEAVKNLIQRGCSGLVVKNVFGLSIPDSTIRYANAKNFPIFISTSTELLFEEFIFDVTDSVRRMESLDYVQREIDAILANETTQEEAYNHGLNLNPSFENQHLAFYIPIDTADENFSYLDVSSRYQGSKLDRPEHLLTMYDEGFLFIYSWEHEAPHPPAEISDELVSFVYGTNKKSSRQASSKKNAGGKNKLKPVVGISGKHYYLGELKESLREAIDATRMREVLGVPEGESKPVNKKEFISISYPELGAFRILLPYCREPVMENYSREILEPLEDYDLETSGRLLETLETYCRYGYSFPETAKKLDQHENTIRYRMEKVAEITGRSYKKPQELQELDLACKIRFCAQTR